MLDLACARVRVYWQERDVIINMHSSRGVENLVSIFDKGD
jgi:hypothetical protein